LIPLDAILAQNASENQKHDITAGWPTRSAHQMVPVDVLVALSMKGPLNRVHPAVGQDDQRPLEVVPSPHERI
jgi:hypothetical protein